MSRGIVFLKPRPYLGVGARATCSYQCMIQQALMNLTGQRPSLNMTVRHCTSIYKCTGVHFKGHKITSLCNNVLHQWKAQWRFNHSLEHPVFTPQM